jgi:hypothetical protein
MSRVGLAGVEDYFAPGSVLRILGVRGLAGIVGDAVRRKAGYRPGTNRANPRRTTRLSPGSGP